MRIGARVAVAGEVLGAHADATVVKPLDGCHDVSRHTIGRGAERAHSDDGIERIRVDVSARREGQIDAETADSLAEGRVGVGRQAYIVDESECGWAWRVAAAGSVETGDVAALLVDRDHDIGASAAELSAQLGDLHIVDDVLSEQQHATEPVADRAEQPRWCLRADERAEQAGCGQPRDQSAALIPSPPLRSGRWRRAVGRAGRRSRPEWPSGWSRP